MKEVMSETRYRGYPVIDLNNRCVGSISRFALLKGLRKKVILVDHNERGQSIPGISTSNSSNILVTIVAVEPNGSPLNINGPTVWISATL